MKLNKIPFLLLSLVALSLPLHSEEVVVSAAASLKDVLNELAPLCLKETGVTLTTNLAASGILAQQIKAGAPADIFISADDETMDGLDKAGLLVPGSRAALVGNALVFVVPADSKLKLDSPAALASDDVKHIGIGDPKTVPAGNYTTTYLEKLKLLPALQPKLIPLDNVRTVLAHVAAEQRGECRGWRSLSHRCAVREESARSFCRNRPGCPGDSLSHRHHQSLQVCTSRCQSARIPA